MATKNNPRISIPLGLPKHVPDLIKEGRARCDAVDARHDIFPTPIPATATIRTALDTLEAAETKTLSVKGATPARDVALGTATNLLDGLRQYVEATARATPAQASAIAAAAHHHERKKRATTLSGFVAKIAKLAHAITLVWPAYKGKGNHGYQIRLSADGGKTWLEPRNAYAAKLTLADLAPGQTYLACVRTNTKAGDGAWSESISFIIP